MAIVGGAWAAAGWRLRVAFVLWIGFLLFIVVPWYRWQDHAHWTRVQWLPFLTPPLRVRDIVANTLVYVPFGLLFTRAIRPSVWAAVSAAFLLSLLTEWTQVYSHGRFPSSTDLLCNTLGAWVGAARPWRWFGGLYQLKRRRR